jgi:hypothetical protein
MRIKIDCYLIILNCLLKNFDSVPGLLTPLKRPANRNQGKYKAFSFTLFRVKKNIFLWHEKIYLLPDLHDRRNT